MEVELWKRPPTRRAEDPLPPRPTTHRNTGCVFTRDGRVGMTSLARLDTMRRMHTTQRSDPNREHDFASRDLFRAVTLAHRHAPKSQRALAPCRGRPHHERAQTTPTCDSERYATPHGTRPPTHLLSTNPIDVRGPESTHTSAMGRRISRLPPPTAAAQRRAVRWALMSAMHSDVASGHNPDQGTRATKGEHLQRTAEAAAGTLHPGDHDCGSAHHHQRGMGRHAGHSNGWRTDILIISNPTGRTGQSGH
jgi:hypothetical protein